MAGIHAVTDHFSNEGLLCQDGWPIEPLDAIHLLFPNKGRLPSIPHAACFPSELFEFPLLRDLLPDQTKFFVPDHVVDSVVVISLLAMLVTVGMIAVKRIWCALDNQFASIAPEHKQWYVVANMAKAFFLACISLSTRFWIGFYLAFYHDKFQMTEIKRCAFIYLITDLVALYMVPKLPKSTTVHHVITVVLGLVISGVDISVPGWTGLLGCAKMCLLYGTMSAVAFPVNAYLALRVVYPEAKWLQTLAKVGMWSYLVLCFGNWSVHFLWLVGLALSAQLSVYNLIYVVAISFMINDDIVLIKWLIRRSSPMADDHSDKQEE